VLQKTFARQNPNIDRKDFGAVIDTIKRGQIFYGDSKDRFERKLAEYLGLPYVITCNMGRGAELFALKGLGLSPGDEIIMASYNFPIVPVVIKLLGLKPVFVDVCSDTFNIDPQLIEKSITKKTKAILVTHIAGQTCEMDTILSIKKKYGLRLIEDVVQAFGAEYKDQKAGTFGDVSYFSFYIGKNMTTFMGAAVCTNDKNIFERMKKMADNYQMLSPGRLFGALSYGTVASLLTRPLVFKFTVYPLIISLNACQSQWLDDFMAESFSISSEIPSFCMQKFTNMQATIGLSQFKKRDASIDNRILNAQLLTRLIIPNESVTLPHVKEGNKHVFMYYFVSAKKRNEFRRLLSFKGVDTKRDSNLACSHLSIFKEEYVHCPISEKISQENVLIPNYPLLSTDNILHIANMINGVTQSIK